MYPIVQARYTVDRVEESNRKNHRNVGRNLHAFGSANVCKNSILKFMVESFSVPSYSTCREDKKSERRRDTRPFS